MPWSLTQTATSPNFVTSNLFIVKDGVAFTPVANGTFLNGVTRQRVAALLREDGVEVKETTLTYADVIDADEIFSTGILFQDHARDPNR